MISERAKYEAAFKTFQFVNTFVDIDKASNKEDPGALIEQIALVRMLCVISLPFEQFALLSLNDNDYKVIEI